MDARDLSILTQVAFKGAIEAGDDVTTDEGLSAFTTRFAALTEALVEQVKAQTSAVAAPSVPTGAAAPADPVTILANEGMTAPVTVRGEQFGPLPDWLISAAAAAGVTTVYDKRDKVQSNPKHPWFKSTDKFPNKQGEMDYKPFWPPRG